MLKSATIVKFDVQGWMPENYKGREGWGGGEGEGEAGRVRGSSMVTQQKIHCYTVFNIKELVQAL